LRSGTSAIRPTPSDLAPGAALRVIAHNGEINTLKGNINWMKAHETRMATAVYGDFMADIKPVIPAGGSDSAMLDNVFESMVGVGRTLPMVKALLIPDTWAERETMPKAHRDLYSYCKLRDGAWDGPAGICAFGGNWCSRAWTATACGRCATPSPATGCCSRVRRPAWSGSMRATSSRRAASAPAR